MSWLMAMSDVVQAVSLYNGNRFLAANLVVGTLRCMLDNGACWMNQICYLVYGCLMIIVSK